MDCFADGVQVVILVLKHIQLYVLLRVILHDSFGRLTAFGILMALHHQLLTGGQLGKHLLVFGPDWFFKWLLGCDLLPHVI